MTTRQIAHVIGEKIAHIQLDENRLFVLISSPACRSSCFACRHSCHSSSRMLMIDLATGQQFEIGESNIWRMIRNHQFVLSNGQIIFIAQRSGDVLIFSVAQNELIGGLAASSTGTSALLLATDGQMLHIIGQHKTHVLQL